MQQFFIDYGLWLLIALLILIAVVFLLVGQGKSKTISTIDSPATRRAREEPGILIPEGGDRGLGADPDGRAQTIVPGAPESAALTQPTPSPAPTTGPAPSSAPTPASSLPSALAPSSSPAPEHSPAPSPAPAHAPIAALSGEESDNLLKMKGIGPKLNQLLIELGVTRYAQIAAWSDTDIAAIDARLGNFKGRPVRDQWVDQAKYLAAGDIAGFEAKYGKL